MNRDRSPDTKSRFRGCLLGLAAGDAVGTALEFEKPGTFEPINDMVGGGPFDLRPGEWTDDTSMALCLATSLVECGGFDAKDQMQRYCRWWREGYLGSNGECFDIGSTVAAALQRFERDGEPYAGSTDPQAAGNGSLMRLAPVPMFYFRDIEAAGHHAAQSSRTTHGAIECIDACRLLARILVRALQARPKQEVLLADSGSLELTERIAAIASANYQGKQSKDMQGSGYVVRSLEAALWAFETTDNFRDAILAAANLGDDADTTAAVCGQLAGAYYGEQGIPRSWAQRLAKRGEITLLAEKLYTAANTISASA